MLRVPRHYYEGGREALEVAHEAGLGGDHAVVDLVHLGYLQRVGGWRGKGEEW
jgi:hypothetical protein